MTGLGNSVAQVLAPVLVPLLGQLAKWIARNRQLIASKVAEYVQRFASFLQSINWKQVEDGATGIAGSINHVVSMFGGWQTAAEGVLAFMAGRWALGILAPIAKVTAAMLRLVLVTAATGGGIAGGIAKKLLAKGMMSAGLDALDVAMAPLLGAYAGFTLGKTGIGKNDTLLKPSGPKNVEDMVRAEAMRQGVDPNEAVAIMRQESGGDNSLVSPAGAVGLMGLMPSTAAGLGVDPTDPVQNARGGIAYYKQLLERFHGNRDAAEAAYNAGPNAMSVRYFAAAGDRSRLPNETQRYIDSVDATRSQLAYKPGAPIQPVKVQVELTHANAPPPGFKARVKKQPNVGQAMQVAGNTPGYAHGY